MKKENILLLIVAIFGIILIGLGLAPILIYNYATGYYENAVGKAMQILTYECAESGEATIILQNVGTLAISVGSCTTPIIDTTTDMYCDDITVRIISGGTLENARFDAATVLPTETITFTDPCPPQEFCEYRFYTASALGSIPVAVSC